MISRGALMVRAIVSPSQLIIGSQVLSVWPRAILHAERSEKRRASYALPDEVPVDHAHDYVGFVMASLVILHIYFNFRPLKTFVKILSGSKE